MNIGNFKRKKGEYDDDTFDDDDTPFRFYAHIMHIEY